MLLSFARTVPAAHNVPPDLRYGISQLVHRSKVSHQVSPSILPHPKTCRGTTEAGTRGRVVHGEVSVTRVQVDRDQSVCGRGCRGLARMAKYFSQKKGPVDATLCCQCAATRFLPVTYLQTVAGSLKLTSPKRCARCKCPPAVPLLSVRLASSQDWRSADTLMAPAFLKARAPSLHWVTVPRHPFSCPPLPLPFGSGLWWAFPLFRPHFSMNKRHPSPTPPAKNTVPPACSIQS